MTHEIIMMDGSVNFAPRNTLEEIIQNIRTIISTSKGSVPLYRDFGVNDSFLDKPVSVARNMIVKEVKEAIEKYEPRAKFQGINWNGQPQDGVLYPTVKVVIDDAYRY